MFFPNNMNILAVKSHAVNNQQGIDVSLKKTRGYPEYLEINNPHYFLKFMMYKGLDIFENNPTDVESEIIVRSYLGRSGDNMPLEDFFYSSIFKQVSDFVRKPITSVNSVVAKKPGFFENLKVSKIVKGLYGRDEENPLAHALIADDSTEKKSAKNEVFLRRLFRVSVDKYDLAMYQIKEPDGRTPVAYAVEREKIIGYTANNASNKPIIQSPTFYIQAIDYSKQTDYYKKHFDIGHIVNEFEDVIRSDYLSGIPEFGDQGLQVFQQIKADSSVSSVKGIVKALGLEALYKTGLKKI